MKLNFALWRRRTGIQRWRGIKPGLSLLFIFLGICAICTLYFTRDIEYEPAEFAGNGRYIIIDLNGREVLIDVEQYVLFALAAQMLPATEQEALKAQAILIRTEVYRLLDGGQTIQASQIGLPYQTLEDMKNTWDSRKLTEYYRHYYQAVSDTKGMVIVYKDEYITAFFHAVSNGYTRESDDYAWLDDVKSEGDVEADNYLQVYTLSLSEWNGVIKRDSSGYVTKVVVGDKEWNGAEFAEILGIDSECFYIQEYSGGYRVITAGIGTGYGMSQWGAVELAEAGESAEDILNYYFKNISVEEVNK